MDETKELILLKKKDKTKEIKDIKYEGYYAFITFKNNHTYKYRKDNLECLKADGVVNINGYIVIINGVPESGIDKIIKFNNLYKVFYKNKKNKLVHCSNISFQPDILNDDAVYSLFSYFKGIAKETGLMVGDGYNILANHYYSINSINEGSVLGMYLSKGSKPKTYLPPQNIIYPFGINLSQKEALNNALTSQVSIIEGPPGTGKTQTILNIIGNCIINEKTVAVLSSNNSATMNVVKKLEKNNLDFLTAYLGNTENKECFLKGQTGEYPKFDSTVLSLEELNSLMEGINSNTKKLVKKLEDKNRIGRINQELLNLETEYSHYKKQKNTVEDIINMSSKKLITFLNEFEDILEKRKTPGFFKRLLIRLKYNKAVLELFSLPPKTAINIIETSFYINKIKELTSEKDRLEESLNKFHFEEDIKKLENDSMTVFKDYVNRRYSKNSGRTIFRENDLRRSPEKVNKEYPVILSTAYSVRSALGSGYKYDYVIVDEASQVDLVTGILALSCAENIVIVGDSKQLPAVITKEDAKAANKYFNPAVTEEYLYTEESLLTSIKKVFKDAPKVLLKEHYRCNPSIIEFCNRRFYNNELIVMTEDNGNYPPLTLYKTVKGNHARNRVNKREIDVVKEEILTNINETDFKDTGIISPYRNQVNAIKEMVPGEIEVDTVHKFQGREKDIIIISSVDNTNTSDFSNDPNLLNVAVSRAVNSLIVVTNGNNN